MDETHIINKVVLRGTLFEPPHFSHKSREECFFQFPLEIGRLSGTSDIVNIVARESLINELEVSEKLKLSVVGELRSFNSKSIGGPKLIITVFAREIFFDDGEDINRIELSGTLCKPTNLRITPMGREICDIMLAVNRHYGRSDYLPCIAWGSRAKDTAEWTVGTMIRLDGRIQSRKYIKNIDGNSVEKTAYEVSVVNIERETPEIFAE